LKYVHHLYRVKVGKLEREMFANHATPILGIEQSY